MAEKKAADPVPVPEPVKITYTLYVDCSTCAGTGQVNGIGTDGSPTMIDCPVCGGSKQIKWGTIVSE